MQPFAWFSLMAADACGVPLVSQSIRDIPLPELGQTQHAIDGIHAGWIRQASTAKSALRHIERIALRCDPTAPSACPRSR